MVKVAASILSADFSCLGKQVAFVCKNGVSPRKLQKQRMTQLMREAALSM